MLRLKVDELKPSVSNVRSKHSKEDIQMMADSITHRGIINPPSVAKNGDGRYEVVAGFLRTLGAAKAGVDEIECVDVTALTPSERTEISLSENVDRRGMSAMQYYAAFNKLFKAGMPVEKIGERFSKTEREVQQFLAIGSLPKKILDLADAEEIGDRTIQALAIANGKDVIRYGKLTAKERPRDWEIQEWLAGEKGMFMEKYALFDLELYVGPKITDLFADTDEVWLMDGEQFWELQAKAYDAILKGYDDKGWQIEQVEHWQPWAYERVAKKKGGKVIWSKNERSGEIEFHAGYKRISTSGKAPKAKAKADGKPEAKPATSQAFNNFMDETRHAALQAFMVQNNRVGIEGTLALLLKQADNVSFRSAGLKLSDAYSDSLHSGDDFIYVHDAYTDMLTELGMKEGHTWDVDLAKLSLKFDEYKTAQLVEWIVLTVTYNWNMESKKATDALGKGLEIIQVTNWKADDAFWDGIKNKDTLLKIAKENSITVSKHDTMKKVRGVLKSRVPATWRPSWLIF